MYKFCMVCAERNTEESTSPNAIESQLISAFFGAGNKHHPKTIRERDGN